jgi:hypothetical protein
MPVRASSMLSQMDWSVIAERSTLRFSKSSNHRSDGRLSSWMSPRWPMPTESALTLTPVAVVNDAIVSSRFSVVFSNISG